MPIERVLVSISQFCDLLAIDPARFIGVTRLNDMTVTILLEPEDDMQTRGSIPQLMSGKKSGGKGGKKVGC